jgi:hypothetical protein
VPNNSRCMDSPPCLQWRCWATLPRVVYCCIATVVSPMRSPRGRGMGCLPSVAPSCHTMFNTCKMIPNVQRCVYMQFEGGGILSCGSSSLKMYCALVGRILRYRLTHTYIFIYIHFLHMVCQCTCDTLPLRDRVVRMCLPCFWICIKILSQLFKLAHK